MFVCLCLLLPKFAGRSANLFFVVHSKSCKCIYIYMFLFAVVIYESLILMSVFDRMIHNTNHSNSSRFIGDVSAGLAIFNEKSMCEVPLKNNFQMMAHR